MRDNCFSRKLFELFAVLAIHNVSNLVANDRCLKMMAGRLTWPCERLIKHLELIAGHLAQIVHIALAHYC